MNDFWVVDIESSGLSPMSYPIEIGIYSSNRQYQALIKPTTYWYHWSKKSEALHNISRKELFNKGRRIDRVAQELNRLLESSTIYSDHADWDGFWLRQLFRAAHTQQTFTVLDISELLCGDNMKNYTTIFNKLNNSPNHQRHRALEDARIIHKAMTHAFNGQTEGKYYV